MYAFFSFDRPCCNGRLSNLTGLLSNVPRTNLLFLLFLLRLILGGVRGLGKSLKLWAGVEVIPNGVEKAIEGSLQTFLEISWEKLYCLAPAYLILFYRLTRSSE